MKIEDNAIIKGRIGWKNLKSEEYTDEGPYLIAGKHINNGIINWDECDHITIERYDESPEIALKNGDIIFSKDGSLGNPALIKNLRFEATINGTMMLVKLNQNKINPNYFYQVLNSDYFFRLLHLLKSGSSIPHIFQRDMVNFKFPICSLDEQKKIARFLEKIDKKIELLEKREDELVSKKNWAGYRYNFMALARVYKDSGNEFKVLDNDFKLFIAGINNFNDYTNHSEPAYGYIGKTYSKELIELLHSLSLSIDDLKAKFNDAYDDLKYPELKISKDESLVYLLKLFSGEDIQDLTEEIRSKYPDPNLSYSY